MPAMTLDQFLRRVNEVTTGSQVKVVQIDEKGAAIPREILDVFVQYDTRKTEIVIKIK